MLSLYPPLGSSAGEVTNIPAGNVSSTTVQDAINELDTEKQATDATLTSLSALGTVADKIAYTTGVDTWAETSLTAAARTVLDDATVSAMVDTLGEEASTGTGGLVRKDAPTITGKSLFQDARFAAVVATLPAITIVAHCPHLAKDDTDLGAWRKRKGQSWRSETRTAGRYAGGLGYATAALAVAAGYGLTDYYYNTTNSRFEEITATGTPASTVTYRAGKEDYPTNAYITAEAARVIIWDLDGAYPTMWMVFINATSGGGGAVIGRASTVLSSVSATNDTLVVGHMAGTSPFLAVIKFTADLSYAYTAVAKYGDTVLPLALRNSTWHYNNAIGTGIVNVIVNSVAITILPDAPYDEYGMPVPTIYVPTDAGVSVINDDGTVADLVDVAGDDTNECTLDKRNNLYYTNETQGHVDMYLSTNQDADDTTPDAVYSTTSIPALLAAIDATKYGLASTGNAVIAGHNTGLSYLFPNPTTQASGAVAYITSTYNTGHMVGDIRGAWLANSATADRSVKANTLTQNGTVTETTQTGGLSTYSGWSAANNLTRASDGDWDTVGTGAICMMGWFKCTGNSAVESLAGFANAGGTVRLIATLTAAGLLECIDDGATAAVSTATTVALDNSAYHHFAFVRMSSTSRALYVDGKLITSNTTDAGSITDTGNLPLYVGVSPVDGTSTPATTTSMALIRLSATAPTAEQIADIYAQEAPLFVTGATCLLSNSSTVSGLMYHKHDGLLEVKNGTATDYFAGLQRVGSVTTTSGITGATAEGQVPRLDLLTSGTTNKFWAAERNISAELAEMQQTYKRTQTKTITTDGSGNYALNSANGLLGWKAYGMAQTASANATITQTFDGYAYTITGLTAATAYTINLVEA